MLRNPNQSQISQVDYFIEQAAKKKVSRKPIDNFINRFFVEMSQLTILIHTLLFPFFLNLWTGKLKWPGALNPKKTPLNIGLIGAYYVTHDSSCVGRKGTLQEVSGWTFGLRVSPSETAVQFRALSEWYSHKLSRHHSNASVVSTILRYLSRLLVNNIYVLDTIFNMCQTTKPSAS